MQIVSAGVNLHEMSKPVSRENKKNTSICRLLKILPRVLSTTLISLQQYFKQTHNVFTLNIGTP